MISDPGMREPMVTAHTTDAQLIERAEALWPVVEAEPEVGKAAFLHVMTALRELLRGGIAPARAAVLISTIGITSSGVPFDEMPGPRVRPR